MTTKYSSPSVEAIQEDSEDDLRVERRGKHDLGTYYRQQRLSGDAMMAPAKGNTGRERERRRKHRSAGSRESRGKAKEGDVKRAIGRLEGDRPRIRHRRTMSNRTSSSTSSSEDEEEQNDHREVLAHARARLTSPSMVSTLTSLTQSTNRSSGSSGSNSTVTQASITKRSPAKRPEIPEAPMSPAVPDPPNVFAFMVNGSCTSLVDGNEHYNNNEEEHDGNDRGYHEENEEYEKHDEGYEDGEKDQWPSHEFESPAHLSPDHGSASSSASSSTHGSEHFSEHQADNDTDRSTSPERSIKNHTSDQEHETYETYEAQETHEAPTDPASTKLASQIAAAQERQNLHAYANSAAQLGTPNMAQGNAVYPYIPHGSNSSALSPRNQQDVKQRSLPRVEKVPVTGYELLASRLSHANKELDGGVQIKPMYRKFGALNHRVLLHLQDELSELEEQLHRLDHADTQSRIVGVSGVVVPASRRAAQVQGGDLEWHKTDVLGRIGFKLSQYNQALGAFNTTQALHPPHPTDISLYREYLHSEQPIHESETHFLDPTDDLVSVCSDRIPRSPGIFSPETQTSYASSVDFSNGQVAGAGAPPGLSSLAIAIAVAVLVPILTFSVIPGFIGRLTVTGLVAGGVVGALLQSGIIAPHQTLGRDGLVCGGVYGGVMIVLAGITS